MSSRDSEMGTQGGHVGQEVTLVLSLSAHDGPSTPHAGVSHLISERGGMDTTQTQTIIQKFPCVFSAVKIKA